MKDCVYLTTSPCAPTREPDLDLAFELTGADAFARYHRLRGRDVRVVATAVEQGRGAERLAYERGGTPQDLIEQWAERWEAALGALNVALDDHVRTTEARHQRVVKAIFLKLFDQGAIYKGTREGPYCARCAEFVGPVADQTCTACGGPLTQAAEEAFFLRASNHQKNILARLQEDGGFIEPGERGRAVVERLTQSGVSDPAISRAGNPWAIAVPIDPDQAIEPWFDALLSYLTGSGYLAEPQTFERYWPPTAQVVATEGLTTHSAAWPALLMSLGLPLPLRLVVRGTLRAGGGNEHANPGALADHYGTDALRHALLRDFAFVEGGAFSVARLVELHNEHLAGTLAGLLERIVGFALRRRGATIPKPGQFGAREDEVIRDAERLLDEVGNHIEHFDFPAACERLWQTVSRVSEYCRPLSDPQGSEGSSRRADTTLYVAAEASRLVALALWPLLPGTAEDLLAGLGLDPQEELAQPRPRWGHLSPNTRVAAEGRLAAPLTTPPQEA